MFLSSMRTGIFSGLFLTILLLGGVGLMLSDWGGFFHNGVGKTDVVQIDGKPLKAVEFDQIVRRSLQGQNMTSSEAYQAGIIDKIMQQEVMRRLLYKASKEYGIVPSDTSVARQLNQILEPVAGASGDKKEALQRILRAQNMREPQLVNTIRDDLSTGLLRETIGEGIYVPQSMTNAFYEWNLEQRNIQYISIPDKGFQPAKPDDKTLATFYEQVKGQYMIPETRDVTVGIIDPAQLVKKAEVTDKEIQDYYDSHKQDYAVPETRTLAQVVSKTEDDAKKVLTQAQKDKKLKDAAEDQFTADSLPDALSDVAFSAKVGDFAGPVKTSLGWHVVQVKSINPAKTRDFAEVKDKIRAELANADSSDAIFEITNEIEDRLAGGETPEAMAGDFKMKVIPLGKIQQGAATPAISEYGEEQAKILAAAFATRANDSSPLSEIKGGKMFTVHVNSMTEAKAKDLKDVRGDVEAQWAKIESRRKMLVKAMELTTALDAGTTTLDKLAKEYGTSVKSALVVRGSTPPEGIDKQSVAQIMAADLKKSLALPDANSIDVVQIKNVVLPEKKATASELENISKNLGLDLQEERFVAFVNEIERRHRVKVNQALLDRMYGQTATE